MSDRSRGEGHVWHWTLEQRQASGPRGEPIDVLWLRLPGFLGRDNPTDCEAIFGDDWETPVLERALPHDRWWLWWTESTSLKGLAEDAPHVRRARSLPDAWPPREPTVWIGRGALQNFGAALLPPDPALHALVLRHGPSSYSEIDPNFVLVLSPRASSPSATPSPADLQRRLRKSTPDEPGFDLLGVTVDRLLMQWDGDMYLALRRADEGPLLDSIEAWAKGFGVRVERR